MPITADQPRPTDTPDTPDTPDTVDVLVIGAGISGIGAAYHLLTQCPGRSFTIIEGRDDIGGTWDLFRYPGVRSDSDMHTLGFSFKPWTSDQAIADGPSIMSYLRDTVRQFGIDRHIRFGHRIHRMEWSTVAGVWTVTGVAGGEPFSLTARVVFSCAGYYSYQRGHQPDFAGRDDFAGTIVHPQFWPADLDYRGKRVVVIGSGATAMTLVPAMTDRAAHVTMVQRSPTYVVSRPSKDVVANTLRRLLPDRWAHTMTRAKNVRLQQLLYRRSRAKPDKMRSFLVGQVRRALGPDYPVDTHFNPVYNPWEQRLCLIPNGDLFTAINSGAASVVTGQIERFVADGVQLTGGEVIPADIIVTATGLEVVTLGEIECVIDGRPLDAGQTFTYRGVALSGVPNLLTWFGYINASWTLRADMISQFACRLLREMSRRGAAGFVPELRASDAGMPARPAIDGFSAGYLQRVMHLLPKQGDRAPWLSIQDYDLDRAALAAPLDDGALRWLTAVPPPRADTGGEAPCLADTGGESPCLAEVLATRATAPGGDLIRDGYLPVDETVTG